MFINERFETVPQTTSLSELMRDFPLIEIAQENQNAEILKFLESIEMKTSRLSLRYDRSPDFFAFSKLQAIRSFHFLFRNPDGQMCGLAVMSFRPMRIRNQIETVGYGSDLRISSSASRKTRLQWRKLYSLFMLHLSSIEEFGGARYFLTSVFDENRAAISAFVDEKGRDLLYRPLFPYQSLNIFAKWPKPFQSKATSDTQTASFTEIREFLASNLNQSEIQFSEIELDRLQQILSFDSKDFLILRDPDNQIRACALPWSDQKWRRLKVDALPRFHQFLGQALPLIGRPAVKLGEPLRIQHLGFFKAKSLSLPEQIQDQLELLNLCWQQRKTRAVHERPHLISLRDRQDSNLPALLRSSGYLFFAIPAHLYQVVHPMNAIPEKLLKFDPVHAPDFELGLA